MSNDTLFYRYDKPDELTKMMRPPTLAQRFGPEAWVYSEMTARCMVLEAYERGKKEASTGESSSE